MSDIPWMDMPPCDWDQKDVNMSQNRSGAVIPSFHRVLIECLWQGVGLAVLGERIEGLLDRVGDCTREIHKYRQRWSRQRLGFEIESFSAKPRAASHPFPHPWTWRDSRWIYDERTNTYPLNVAIHVSTNILHSTYLSYQTYYAKKEKEYLDRLPLLFGQSDHSKSLFQFSLSYRTWLVTR